jgi:septum formation protein
VSGPAVTLASASTIRAEVLRGAGVVFEVFSPGVDEAAVKAGLLAEGASPRDVADALAELKSVRAARGRPGLVIGADQTLDLDGGLYDKVATLEEARRACACCAARSTNCTPPWWSASTERRSGARW